MTSGEAEAYKRFPPGSGQLRVPTSSRASAQAGISMYGASRTKALWSQRVVWGLVSALGPRVLPGRTSRWTPPMEPAQWSGLVRRWSESVAEFQTVAVYERTQAERQGFDVLLFGVGGPLAFIKLHPEGSGRLEREAQALAGLAAHPPARFSSPELLADGAESGWRYLAMSPLPLGLHRPPGAIDIDSISSEIGAVLQRLPRDPSLPAHWQPMHGDLTPWNLRSCADRSLVLVDWEDADWGPPGADAVLYRAAEAALGTRPLRMPERSEAIDFWERRIRARSRAQLRDATLSDALLGALRVMQSS